MNRFNLNDEIEDPIDWDRRYPCRLPGRIFRMIAPMTTGEYMRNIFP